MPFVVQAGCEIATAFEMWNCALGVAVPRPRKLVVLFQYRFPAPPKGPLLLNWICRLLPPAVPLLPAPHAAPASTMFPLVSNFTQSPLTSEPLPTVANFVVLPDAEPTPMEPVPFPISGMFAVKLVAPVPPLPTPSAPVTCVVRLICAVLQLINVPSVVQISPAVKVPVCKPAPMATQLVPLQNSIRLLVEL